MRTEPLSERSTAVSGCLIRVLEGPDEGAEYDLREGEIVIGTAGDLELSDSAVSGRHVIVRTAPGGIDVEDLGSTNGTYYLGTRLARAIVPAGAVLKLGRTSVALLERRTTGAPAASRASYGAIIGSAPAMCRLYAVLEQIERTDYTVLIQGETGVGKELVAKEIHRQSARRDHPFEVCDATALPATLAESELFGHEAGAFTGAQGRYRGVFERANGGTVFIDEIGDLPAAIQPKLLRVLDSKTIRPLGAESSIDVDVRIIAATHRDLEAEVQAKRFREDLFFRLNIVRIVVPPLRERREDIRRLVEHFLEDAPRGAVTDETIELMTTGYDWAGNVRELSHAVKRVLALGALPDGLQEAVEGGKSSIDTSQRFQDAKRRIIDRFERDYVVAQLANAEENISRAARSSGVERNQFKRLMKKHGLVRPSSDDADD